MTTRAAQLFPALLDATNNLHVGLALDNHTTPSAMAGKVDYVWGTEWAGTPAGNAYYTFYIPYDSDEKAVVNPSSTQTYTVTLPANTFQDLYGNAVNSVTLGIHSGIVLLDSNSGMTPTSH